MVGRSLRYVAERGGQWLALLGWASPALKCPPQYLDWMATDVAMAMSGIDRQQQRPISPGSEDHAAVRCRCRRALCAPASLDDSCARHGRRHSQRSLLAIVLCAVISGAQGPIAIAKWGRRLPPPMLRCRRAADGRYEPPSEPTIRRLLQAVDIEALEAQPGGVVCKCRRPWPTNPWHSMARPCVARRMVAMGQRLWACKRRGLE